MISSGRIRWRSAKYKSNDRSLLCKQAFHWRLLKHIILPAHPTQKEALEDRMMKKKVNYYNGELNEHEFRTISSDPVPKLIALFGGLNRLSQREKRYLGITEPQSSPIRPSTKVIEINETRSVLPKYSKLQFVPGFGVYEGRKKVFKGKKRERGWEEKVQEVGKRMEAMELRVSNYRKEWRLNKEKSKPSLPF